MSLAAIDRAAARLLFQQLSFSAASSAPFSRAESPSSVTASMWTPSRNHSQRRETKNNGDDTGSPSLRKEQHVDQSLMRFLVGKGGSTKEKLEKENNVKLWISSSYEARFRSSIVINGSEPSVKAASIAIQKILDDAVKSKLQYTHFISLPLALHPAFVQKVESFQKSILDSLQSSPQDAESTSGSEASESADIDQSIFVKPSRIHLTILMLKLWNEERIQAASDLLKKLVPFVHEALEDQPVLVDLQGLECLRGTPDKAHVLYAEIKDSKDKVRLLQTCQVLIDAFVESGLVMERDIGQSLKLHVTLMNTTQRKPQKEDYASKRVPFDARNILAKYGDWNWGEYTISEAHLSQRFVYDENGYYHCVSSIPLPGHTSKS